MNQGLDLSPIETSKKNNVVKMSMILLQMLMCVYVGGVFWTSISIMVISFHYDDIK